MIEMANRIRIRAANLDIESGYALDDMRDEGSGSYASDSTWDEDTNIESSNASDSTSGEDSDIEDSHASDSTSEEDSDIEGSHALGNVYDEESIRDTGSLESIHDDGNRSLHGNRPSLHHDFPDIPAETNVSGNKAAPKSGKR